MTTHEATLSPATQQLITRIFAADHALDADAFVQVLTPTAQFRLGGIPATTGHAATRRAVAAFFATLTALQHELMRAWDVGPTLIYEAVVHYTLKDGRALALPYVNVLDRAGDLVQDYHIYIDLSPLLAHP